MADAITAYYDAVDNLRLDEFMDRHTDDASVRFGNNPPVQGKEAIRESISGFWSMLNGMTHTVKNRWDDGDTTVLEANVAYDCKDGRIVEVPCVSILERKGEQISDLRVLIDLTPLFAPQ